MMNKRSTKLNRSTNIDMFQQPNNSLRNRREKSLAFNEAQNRWYDSEIGVLEMKNLWLRSKDFIAFRGKSEQFMKLCLVNCGISDQATQDFNCFGYGTVCVRGLKTLSDLSNLKPKRQMQKQYVQNLLEFQFEQLRVFGENDPIDLAEFASTMSESDRVKACCKAVEDQEAAWEVYLESFSEVL